MNLVELNYEKPSFDAGKPSLSDSPWRFVELKEGNELLVFHCKKITSPNKFRFIISDKNLIPGIKKSVQRYISCRKNPNLLLETPDIIKSETDMTFIGYLFSFLAEAGAIQHADTTSLVLSQLLEIDKIPDVNMNSARFQLVSLVSGDPVFPISQASRETAINNLINVAVNDKKLSVEAIQVLAGIIDKGRIDLRPYFNEESKKRLLAKLHSSLLGRISDKHKNDLANLLQSK